MNFIEIADIDLIYGDRSGVDKGTATLALSKADLSVGHNEFIALVVRAAAASRRSLS